MRPSLTVSVQQWVWLCVFLGVVCLGAPASRGREPARAERPPGAQPPGDQATVQKKESEPQPAPEAGEEPPSRLEEMPAVQFDPSKYQASVEQREEIARLIEQLAEIDGPDYGMAPSMSGSQFAPIKSSRHFGGGIIMIDHRLTTSGAVEKLVAFGPRALPALLESLGDGAPTRYKVEHTTGFGSMWYGREIGTNPANPRENGAVQAHPDFFNAGDADGLGRGIPEHVMTRGDVCFLVIGQIVNRAYQAARYQPTACLVINSPTHDPEMAKIVREFWISPDPAEMLFRSLMTDLYSRGGAAEYQTGAAMRLLYYFPDESRDLLVRRLDSFDVHSIRDDVGGEGAWEKQWAANGDVMANDFIKAVSFSEDPAITGAILRILQRTDNPDVFEECLTEASVQANPDLVFARMASIVAVAPPARMGPFGGEYYTLRAAVRFFPAKALPLFDTYLKHGTLETRRASIHALSEPGAPLPWAVGFLVPLLDDRTETGWHYGPDFDRKPIRVCDEAARVLTFHVPGATFELEGDTENLDRQIENIRLRIAGRPVVEEPVVSAKIDFDSVARRAPVASFTMDAGIPAIYDFSDGKTLYVSIGYQADGWVWDTVTIEAASGRQTGRIKLDEWRGAVKVLQPIVGDIAVCYHADVGGDLVTRDVRTGKELGRVATPFHDMGRGFRPDDPMIVRGLGDIFLTGDGKAVIALTPDGSLHSVDLATGKHEVVWKREGKPRFEGMGFRGMLTPVQGTNRMLLYFFGEHDRALCVWDHDTRTMTEIQKVPNGGWRSAWGKYAVNHTNNNIVLWDLEARKPIDLPLPEGAKVSEVVCDNDQSAVVAATSDGEVWVIDVKSLTPRARLRPPPTTGRTTLTLSRDNHLLFWKSDETEVDPQSGERKEPKTAIAIFEVSDLTK